MTFRAAQGWAGSGPPLYASFIHGWDACWVMTMVEPNVPTRNCFGANSASVAMAQDGAVVEGTGLGDHFPNVAQLRLLVLGHRSRRTGRPCRLSGGRLRGRTFVGFLDTGGARLCYTDVGSGPPLVLVHGWSCDSVDWTWLIPHLGDQFRVIAYDRRGHGRSSGTVNAVLRKDLADLIEMVERVAGEPAVLVGHSLGAALVSVLAVERPEVALGVVTLDPPFPVDASARAGVEGLGAAITEEAGASVVQSFLAQSGFTDQTPEWLRTLVLRRVQSHSGSALHDEFFMLWDDQVGVAFRPGAHDYLALRKCPVLLLHQDAERAQYEQATFRHPASRTVVLPGAGHWLQAERPEEVAGHILDWWTTARPRD